ERDQVRGDRDERDPPRVEPRLPLLVHPAGRVAWAAKEVHEGSLRGRGGGERAGDELRLLRRGEVARGLEPEGGADRVAGECAEARAAEIALVAGCFGFLAHCRGTLGVEGRRSAGDHRPDPGLCKALPQTKTDEFPAVSNRPKPTSFSPSGAGLPGRATPGENSSQG